MSLFCSAGVNLLVGTENGLWLLDRSGQGKVYSLINRRRFQQMDVLEGLNVLITISGTLLSNKNQMNEPPHVSATSTAGCHVQCWTLFVVIEITSSALILLLLQVKRISCVCTTCPGWETRFCITTQKWRRGRAGLQWGTWRGVDTIKWVSEHWRNWVDCSYIFFIFIVFIAIK